MVSTLERDINQNTVVEENHASTPLSSSSIHSDNCRLWQEMEGRGKEMIQRAARYDLNHASLQIVVDSIAVCAYCREQFHQHQVNYRKEEYEYVSSFASELGDLRRYDVALQADRLWFTEDIEAALIASPVLQRLRQEPDLWVGVFRAFLGLMREALDVRHPGAPFVHLTSGLIPRGWNQSDALDYISSEVEADNRTILLGMLELDKLIQSQPDKAMEPLGWFILDKDHPGSSYLVGWEGLLERQFTNVGNRLMRKQENADAITNSLKKEYADALERIQRIAISGEVPV